MLSEWLISPELVAHHVPDPAALERLISDLKVGKVQAGNMRQLMEVVAVGKDGREGCHVAKNWQRYEQGFGSPKSVQCIQQDGSDVLVVLTGDLNHRWKLAKEHLPEIDRTKLARSGECDELGRVVCGRLNVCCLWSYPSAHFEEGSVVTLVFVSIAAGHCRHTVPCRREELTGLTWHC